MDKRSKILLICCVVVTVVFVGLTYYKFVVRKDYVIFTNADNIPSAKDFLKN